MRLLYVKLLLFLLSISASGCITYALSDTDVLGSAEVALHSPGTLIKVLKIPYSEGETISGYSLTHPEKKRLVVGFCGKDETVGYGYLQQFYLSVYKLGYNVMTLDMPGHGSSTGEPTFENLELAVASIKNHLDKLNYKPNEVIIYSYSAGTIAATKLALLDAADHIVLVAAPLDLRENLSAYKAAYAPPVIRSFVKLDLPASVRFNTSETFHTLLDSGKRMLLVHGNKDKTAPYKAVYNLHADLSAKGYSDRVSLLTIDRGTHDQEEIYTLGGKDLMSAFKNFFPQAGVSTK